MSSNWIKATAIILAVCSSIYLVYVTIVYFDIFKHKEVYLALYVLIATVSYIIIFMLIGAIYRIGTLTDHVEYLETKNTQLDIKIEKTTDELEAKIRELEMQLESEAKIKDVEIQLKREIDTFTDRKAENTKKCPNCGAAVEEDYKFCTKCRTKL